MKKRKPQYFGVTHDQNTEPLHAFYEGRLHGARGRERPRRRWGDDVKNCIGMTLAECTITARDRQTELERTSASFGDLRPSAMKMETRRRRLKTDL